MTAERESTLNFGDLGEEKGSGRLGLDEQLETNSGSVSMLIETVFLTERSLSAITKHLELDLLLECHVRLEGPLRVFSAGIYSITLYCASCHLIFL